MKINHAYLYLAGLLTLASFCNAYVQREHYLAATKNNSASINVLDYGAVGDGITDDSDAFANAFADAAAYGNDIFIPKKTYLVNETLDITSGMVIRSAGATLKHTTPKSPIFSAVKADDWVIDGPLTLLGTRTNANEENSEQGLFISGANRYIVDKLTIRGFAGVGINVTAGKPTRAARGDRGKFSSISFYNNHIGLKLESGKKYSAEYNLFSLMSFSGNDIAMDIGTGNNIISTSNIVDNGNGIDITPAKNGGHGILDAVNISHNRGFNLRADTIPQGFSIMGAHMYGDATSGGIDIKNSKDFYFTGGVIDAPLQNDASSLLCGNAVAGLQIIGKDNQGQECKKQ